MTRLGRCATAHCEARWPHCELQPTAPVQSIIDAPHSQPLSLASAHAACTEAGHAALCTRSAAVTPHNVHDPLDACSWRVAVRTDLRAQFGAVCAGYVCTLYCCDRRTSPARRVDRSVAVPPAALPLNQPSEPKAIRGSSSSRHTSSDLQQPPQHPPHHERRTGETRSQHSHKLARDHCEV